jgi:hypothetical protein
MSVKRRTSFRTPEQRRLRKEDFSRISVDRPVYRWFAVWCKVLKELEGQSVEVRQKKFKLGFSNHQWWNLISTKQIPKSPKFIRSDIKNLPRDINKFNNAFFDRYRPHFIEPSTTFSPTLSEMADNLKGGSFIHIPDDYPIRSILDDIRTWYTEKEKKSKPRKSARIILDQVDDNLMKRIFHTFRLSLTTNLDNLQLHFQVQKIMSKRFEIPKIERENAKGGLGSRTTGTIRSDYLSEIKKTQRDKQFAKLLLINLGRGSFPKIKRIENP